MQSHLESIGVAHKLAVALLAGVLFGSWAFGSEEPDPVTIKIHRSDGGVASYRAYPENVVKLLFPRDEAIIGPDEGPGKSPAAPAAILKKIQVVEVSDTDRRFNVTGVIVDDQLFIFDGVFSDNDSVTMSQLIQATASGPHSEKEALDLARLYLALSRYRLTDFDRIVAYKSSDSVKKGQDAAYAPGVMHSPEVVQEQGTYAVDFYAYDVPGETVRGASHWKIVVGPNGLEERLSAHHDQFRPFYSRAASEWKPPAGKVIFAPVVMGNGFSDDGAMTDLQSWGSSDGPGLSRVHYYYKSHEQADKRMQDYLRGAVAIIETRPWLDSHGKSVGTEAILIRTNDAQKSLFASFIGEDATTVLETSCPSLGNLLRAADRELPEWRH
jgi:hypothetical protein